MRHCEEASHEGILVSAGNFVLVECLRTLGQQTRSGRQDSRRGAVWAVVGSPGGCGEACRSEEGKEAKGMTFEETVQAIQPGRYRHFKGNEYEVVGVASHSETEEPIAVYRALYGEGGLWVRPEDMWNETVERDGKRYMRFEKI